MRSAAEATTERAREVAAELLEAAPATSCSKTVAPSSPARPTPGVSLGEIAAACDTMSSEHRGDEPGLTRRARIYVDPPMNYPYGVPLAQLEIDPATGEMRRAPLLRRVRGGRAVNPMLLGGQIVGGAIQGLGGALFEEFLYDEAGQPQSTSFMDYLLPGAPRPRRSGPPIREDAPTPTTRSAPRGGRGRLDGAGAAVAGAVDDALGVTRALVAVPIVPERVRAVAAEAPAGRVLAAPS